MRLLSLKKPHLEQIISGVSCDNNVNRQQSHASGSLFPELRPRLNGTGSARLRYQIEYFQDKCCS